MIHAVGSFIEHYANQFLRFCERMEPQHWGLVLIGMVLFGFFCMRGFGSRSNY